jgi:hypothetical protein
MDILKRIDNYLTEGVSDEIKKLVAFFSNESGIKVTKDTKTKTIASFKDGIITLSKTMKGVVVSASKGGKELYKSGKIGTEDTLGNAMDSAKNMIAKA